MLYRLQLVIRALLARLAPKERSLGAWLASPALLILVMLVVLPLLYILVLSLLSRGTYGEVVRQLNINNYARLFDPLYLKIFIYSLYIALLTTALTLVIGYPLAYFITRARPQARNIYISLILVPFWTNFIIRIYAWIILLRQEGLINHLLMSLGLIREPLEILYTPLAVVIGMVYEFLPFMILPLYTSLEKIEAHLLEAAADLGARPWATFFRIVLPLSLPGMVAGSILVFIPAMGMFVVPDLIGGAKTVLIGNVIRNQFLSTRDWPFGSALSMVLLVITLIVTLIYIRRSGFGKDLFLYGR